MRKSFFILPFFVLLWMFCSDYNPFENPTNINVVIVENKSSVYRDSTTTIFTTETLTVVATVKEEIDSFSVTALDNRYWQQRSVKAPISSGEYTFLFSFNDTGTKDISLNTYRSNGDVIPVQFSVHVSTPLSQSDITVERGTVFSLSTPSVGDDDVIYNWRFYKENGTPLLFSYPFSSYDRVEINELLSGDTGYLWVEDSSGNKSPEATFAYSVIDTTGPVIICLNLGLNGDTVVTGAGIFSFKVECNDGLGIGGALINDTSFSDSTVNIKSTMYFKTFSGMDTLSSYFMAVVKAWDTENNQSVDTFYIRYDSDGPKEIITIKNPPLDKYTTNQNPFSVIATIFNPNSGSVVVSVNHIEQSTTVDLDTLAGQAEVDVTYNAPLKLGSNTIIISVTDTGNTVIAKDTVALTYTTGTVEDTTPPYINRITVNGVEGKSHFIAGGHAVLALEAFDEHMDSVVINGRLKTEESKFLWKDTLVLNGEKQYFFIHLNDLSGNAVNDTVQVQRNYLPIIYPPVTWPRTLVLGKPWSRTFSVSDADGDMVAVGHYPAPTSQLPDTGAITFTQINQKLWNAHWNGSADISNSVNQSYETYVVLYDGKQIMPYTWNFSIMDSTQARAYRFYFFLPDGIDTTEEGAINLSTATEPVQVYCIVVADAKPFSEDDIISVYQETQVLSFATDAADTNWFMLTFIPEEIRGNEEAMVITVFDSDQVETIVDTLVVIRAFDFPEHIDSLGWMLRSDTGVAVKENKVLEWDGISISLGANPNTNELYGMETMPIYPPGIIQDFPVLRFTPKEHSNLINTADTWLLGPFTLFFVTRLGPDASKDSGQILISAGAERFIGLGVFGGKMGVYGKLTSGGSDRDTMFTCDMKVSKNQWHILCYSSKHGLGDGNATFDLTMWVDNYAGTNNSIILDNVNGSGMSYMVLGGGSKHKALKNWDGDLAELIKYSQYLNDQERLEVARYLASRYKIKLSNYLNFAPNLTM